MNSINKVFDFKRGYLLGLLAIVIFTGCKREDPEFNGPSLENTFGEFSVLVNFDITDRNVDFLAGETTTFTAQFSKEVDWEVHIKGLATGSEKIIQGFSSGLDASNAKWNGTTTILPMFGIETCAVELRIPSDSVIILDTLSISSNKTIEGIVVADFESGFNLDWTTLVEAGADMSFIVADDIVAGQGSMYYDMGGEVNFGWLVGLIDFPASALGEEHYPLNSDPGKVYFNVMLYLPEDITNEIVLFRFEEDDNDDGVYTEFSEDRYSVELKYELEPGWQLISVKYSDLVALENGAPIAAEGNGILEPNKLTGISCLLIADPSSGYCQTLMDFMVMTENGPLNP